MSNPHPTSHIYSPPFQLTDGQAKPFAANNGLSYMYLDRNGDSGTTAATEDALQQISEGMGQIIIDMIEDSPPGPIETRWGIGFRDYGECLQYIIDQGITAPEGGLVVPLRYTVSELPSYTIVPSNAFWHDPKNTKQIEAMRKEQSDTARRALYFLSLIHI